MQKNGHCNIRKSASEKRARYLSDFFTTMVDLKWRYSLLVFIFLYVVSWAIFSFAYYCIAWNRDQLYDKSKDTPEWAKKRPFVFGKHNHCIASYEDKRCFYNVDGWLRAFLFFVETDTTVGYGRRSISTHCPEAILLFVIQCLYGILLDAFIMGCIFIKVSKPRNRNEALIFSEKACISLRDGKYCMMFRVGNLRNSLIVQCKIRAKLVKSRQTTEGEFIPLDQTDINLGFDTGADKLFLVTPLIVTHEIDEKSPLWAMGESEMKGDQFEIIVILEGTVESTGMICQARTSYLNNEILWGNRFNPLLFLDTSGQDQERFCADLGLFDSTYEVPTPKISAKQMQEELDQEEGEDISIMQIMENGQWMAGNENDENSENYENSGSDDDSGSDYSDPLEHKDHYTTDYKTIITGDTGGLILRGENPGSCHSLASINSMSKFGIPRGARVPREHAKPGDPILEDEPRPPKMKKRPTGFKKKMNENQPQDDQSRIKAASSKAQKMMMDMN